MKGVNMTKSEVINGFEPHETVKYPLGESLRVAAAIVTAFATILTLGGGTAQAATCTVPVPYASIQTAVNDPACSTINVAAGPYFENVTIPRTLTLNGAQAGIPVAGRVSGSPLESTVNGLILMGNNAVITINARSVTIDGFTLRNPVNTGAAMGITVKTAGDGALITNNFIDTITTPDAGGNGTAQAIYLENGPDSVRILGNDMKDVQSTRSAKGVTIGDASSANPSQNVLIEGNSIANITSLSRGAYGVSINNGNGFTFNSGLVIRNNAISTLSGGGWVHAIGLEADTPGVVVRENAISTFLTSPTDAVAVWFEANPSFSGGHVNQNNFDVTPAAYGIAVHPALALTGKIVDGECNWWGAPNGPGPVGTGAGAMVSPNVDYTPWLTSPAPSGSCFGGVPSTPGKATGGGQIEGDPIFSSAGVLLSVPALTASAAGPNGNATFGFVVNCCAPAGNLEYNDHGADVRIKAQSMDGLFISSPGTSCPAIPGSKHATFTGTAQVIRSTGTTTEPFTVDVDDCGEPGTADTFGIKTTTYSNGPSPLIGGNIQIHN
jgi:hypothetical protein